MIFLVETGPQAVNVNKSYTCQDSERDREDELLYLLFPDSITDEAHILSNNFRVASRVTQSTSSTRVCFFIHRINLSSTSKIFLPLSP